MSNNATGIGPLAEAIRSNNIDHARTLIAQGHDVNEKDDGLTPLMIAAGLGNLKMVELLLWHDADVYNTDSHTGATALHKAAQNKDQTCKSVEVARILVEKKKAFVDAQSPIFGHTPLHTAVWHEHTEMVKYLLGQNARTELTTRSGARAIDIARNTDNRQIMQMLGEYESVKSTTIANQGLMTAVRDGDENEVRRILSTLPSKDIIDEKSPHVGDVFDGYTPLLTAAFLGYQNIVEILLANGANIRAVDDQILANVFHKAGYHGRKAVAEKLTNWLENNLDYRDLLDAQGRYNGYTPLHDAIWHCHKETVKVLLDAGADPELTTHSGHTALELAELYCSDKSCYGHIVDLIANAVRKSQ